MKIKMEGSDVEEPMLARIVVAHDEAEFRSCVAASLQAAGYETNVFPGSMEAIEALESAERIELLVTRVTFPPGTPNGVALARMARLKKPGVRVLFTARDEVRWHAEGLGEFLSLPVTGSEVVAAVKRMLGDGAS